MELNDERGEQLSRDLRGAASRGEIVGLYQPQYDLATMTTVSAEILARWEHPSLGTIAPAEFVAIAEREGLIDEIGEHMFRVACIAAADWQARGWKTEVSINVSLVQFRNPEVVERLLAILRDVDVEPARITVEVTESTAVADVEGAVAALTRLAEAGLTISIDDFGSGNSTEHQVNALPARELKIDQSIVQDESPNGRGALGILVDFAKRRNLRVVAEGVYSDVQLQRLQALGVDRAQGYLLGQPMSLDELNSRLSLRSD